MRFFSSEIKSRGRAQLSRSSEKPICPSTARLQSVSRYNEGVQIAEHRHTRSDQSGFDVVSRSSRFDRWFQYVFTSGLQNRSERRSRRFHPRHSSVVAHRIDLHRHVDHDESTFGNEFHHRFGSRRVVRLAPFDFSSDEHVDFGRQRHASPLDVEINEKFHCEHQRFHDERRSTGRIQPRD